MSDAGDFFKNLAAKKTEEKKKEEQERQVSYDFTPMLWSSFKDAGESKLVRFRDHIMVEKSTDLQITKDDNTLLFDKYSGRICEMVQIFNDSNKKKLFFVPNKSDDPSHIFWRLRDVVLKREWVPDPDSTDGKKKALYVHQHTHPELVDRFLTNGNNHGISKNKFDRGWKTQSVLMANLIDYELLTAHRERKSWALISKNVNVVESTVEGQSDAYYYDWGVPSYGFVNQLRDTITHYGSMNSYDMIVERTGEKSTPWKIRNANKYREEVPKHLQSLISDSENLTEEQLGWEMYDIEKITQTSSDLKWFKNLKVLLKTVDLAFKTNFHDEMEAKAKIEEERLALLKAEEEKNKPAESPKEEAIISKEEIPPTPTRSRTRAEAPKESKVEEVTWTQLNELGYKVTEEDFTIGIQALISHVDENGIVRWKDGSGDLIPDDADCFKLSGIDKDGFASPDNPVVDVCLACGRKF